ncbi:MAG: DUF2188 domain-containing protein [Thiohalomonadaceae bacterium]
MPYKVKRQGDKWVVVKKDSGKVVSHHATKEKAQSAIRAIYANEKEE